MKIIFSLFLFFFFITIHSQIVEDDWKKFELNSKWKVNYIQNDSIKENRPHLGELVFLNTNAKEPEFNVVFTVYKSETELNSRHYFEIRRVLKTVTLCHEVIHAYMFNSLEKANYLIFDSTGVPRFNSNLCNTSNNYQNIDLNTLNTADRLLVLLCGMQQAGTLNNNDQWSHIIFNTATFDIVTYRQALENFILANHDWDNESTVFKNRAMNTFGNNWKRKVAQATSWIGLEQTAGYQNYINSHQSNFPQWQYLTEFKNLEILDAKSDWL